MKYVRLVDSSYLKVYPDAGNITNAGVKLQQDVCEDMYLERQYDRSSSERNKTGSIP